MNDDTTTTVDELRERVRQLEAENAELRSDNERLRRTVANIDGYCATLARSVHVEAVTAT